MKSGTCTACPNGALKCKDENTATVCVKAYYLDTGTCYSCGGNNVVTCSNSATTAHLTCDDGYYVNTVGTCTICNIGNNKLCKLDDNNNLVAVACLN